MNILENSGKPLFFKAGSGSGIEAPAPRRGIAVRVAARSLSAMQKEALVASGLSNATWRLSSDEGAYLDGDDAAPCPLAHMTTGMVASFMETAQVLAKRSGIELPHLRLIQDNYYTMKGSALKGTMTGGALPVVLTAQIESGTDLERAEALLRDAVAAAPVRGLMSRVLKSRFTLTHNGIEIDRGELPSAGGDALPLAGELFDSAQPSAEPGGGDWTALMRRNGMSPETDEITSTAGSSFAEEQSRRLHVRGICTLRPDGVKVIEQHLFNPHGSIFFLLSEEGEAAGGRGRAPDAMSYASAGLAFCFLTQFGRYAKIVRKPLKSYSVVQDTHFSPVSAPEPGATDPVETHVHLESDQDDDFARQALRMSEQTCFLHALCRSEVALDLRLQRAKTGN